jgi:hypothetical protein
MIGLPRVRRLAHGCDTPEDRTWLAAALKRYLLAADDGLMLKDALELATESRLPSWWRIDALRQRDMGIRDLARSFCPHPSLAQRAETVAQMLTRYAASGWVADQNLISFPDDAIGTPREIMWFIFKADPVVPSPRQLRRILAS